MREPDSSQQYPVRGQEAMDKNETHQIRFEHKKTPFYCDGGQILE